MTVNVDGANLLSVPIWTRFLKALKMKINAINVANSSSVNLKYKNIKPETLNYTVNKSYIL